jgi:hypothetical protein
MPILTPLISFSRRLLRGQQMEKELDDEVRSHLQLLTEQNIEEGMTPMTQLVRRESSLGVLSESRRRSVQYAPVRGSTPCCKMFATAFACSASRQCLR